MQEDELNATEAMLRDERRLLIKEVAREIIAEVRASLVADRRKEWYSTEELATALGKKGYTIRENWCNAGKIKCEKDNNGKWRIPAAEYDRLTLPRTPV